MSTSENLLKTFQKPEVWATSYLRNPTNVEKSLELRSYQREILENTRNEQNVILRWGRRLGKCNWAKSLITNDLGELVKAEDLCDKEDFGVISCNEKYKFEINSKTKCVYNGKKPIYEIATKSGRRTRVTDNHPFLTVEGWKPLKDIEIGEDIILPSKIDIKSDKTLPSSEIESMAKKEIISNKILRLNDKSIKLFVDTLIKIHAIEKNGKLIYNAKNTEIIQYISSLLLRLGIRYKIYNNQIELYSSDKYFDTIPVELIDKNFNKRINKSEVIKYAKEHNIKSLIDLCKGNVFFDRVKSIDYLFDDDTYELEVNPSHNYIADNMLMHNSVTLCADTLWWATAYPLVRMVDQKEKNPRPFRVLVFCPYQSQIDELWETYTQLIGDSPLLKEQLIKIRRSDVYSIKFKGHGDEPGSTISGYTIGISSSNQGVSLRGLCLDGSTRISMVDGRTKLLSKIDIGDTVLSYDTVESRFVGDIVALKSKPEIKKMFKVTFASGRELISSADHKFLTQHGYKRLFELNLYHDVINEDLLHDWISDIKYIGEKKAYDITTKKYHNFIANGVVTHNSGDMVFVDEMDYIPKEIWQKVIFPITTTHINCMRRICSTPAGKREAFYKYCTRSNELGWFHRHHPSWHPDNDRWLTQEDAIAKGIPVTNSTEYQARESCSSEAFDREYGAEFGDAFGGVYKDNLIDKSLAKYGRNIDVTDTDIFDPGFQQVPEHKYIIGVDWNSYINGGQVVMVEYCSTPTYVNYYDDEKKEDVKLDFTNKYRLFYRRGIKIKGATQRGTREEIIRLFKKYQVDYLYVDYGAGDTNIEELTLYGKRNPGLGLDKKLRVIDSGAVTEHWDHVLKKKVKKRNKSLMINFSVISLEENMFILPKEEDASTRLVGQMRGYEVKNVTTRGDYSYKGMDHILDAFNLALYGFQQNFGQLINDFTKQPISHVITNRHASLPTRVNIDSTKNRKMNTTYNLPTSDPERRGTFQSPKRISVPRLGSRTNFSRGMF